MAATPRTTAAITAELLVSSANYVNGAKATKKPGGCTHWKSRYSNEPDHTCWVPKKIHRLVEPERSIQSAAPPSRADLHHCSHYGNRHHHRHTRPTIHRPVDTGLDNRHKPQPSLCKQS
ncbi:hypothetical protein [Williamsia sp.]|uniref:hypothetical protein n=1 Tax=Williamsia sp. TaxID=1872085 RepID=UPI002F92B93D